MNILAEVYSYKGRWPRKKFVLTHLIILLFLIPTIYFYNKYYDVQIVFGICIVIFFALLATSIMASIKRLQDLSYPGYWIFVALSACLFASQFAYFGWKPLIVLYLCMAVAKGTATENSFGPSLRKPKEDKK